MNNLQDCHDRAWDAIQEFVETNLTVFSAKTSDAEAVLMPSARSWLRKMSQEHGASSEDVGVILVMNCPTVGILTGAKESFFVNFIMNVMADFPVNAMCLLIHPNRAGQSDGRRWAKSLIVLLGVFFKRQSKS